jgi:hypothetical protein
MEDLSLVEYNLYYKLREYVPDYSVILAEETPDLIHGDTIFLYNRTIDNGPLQLGHGLLRTVGFIINVFSSNGTIHNDVVSTISDRFYSAGSAVYDYNTVSGHSNFPYDPADSTIVNPKYIPTIYGWMDFIYCNAINILEEEIDRRFYSRAVIEVLVNYAKE